MTVDFVEVVLILKIDERNCEFPSSGMVEL